MGIATRARVMSRSRRSPLRSRPSRTCVPAGPRTASVTSSTVHPVTGCPSTATITSPACSPAASAGLSGSTDTTTRRQVSEITGQGEEAGSGAVRSSEVTNAPTPSTVPVWSLRATSNASASR